MSSTRSFVAQRAVRLLRERPQGVPSRELAIELLATEAPTEELARRLLEASFDGDGRLAYSQGHWILTGDPVSADRPVAPPPTAEPAIEPDRTFLFTEGGVLPGEGYRLTAIYGVRLREDEVVAACGGGLGEDALIERIRRNVREAIDGSVPLLHDADGALAAVERWLGEPLPLPISLRRLAAARCDLPVRHDFETMMGALGLHWRETDELLERADTLDRALAALRRDGESLADLQQALHDRRPIDWSRFDFDRDFIRRAPAIAGTYRFYDVDGQLLYVGKAKNLNRRLASYFSDAPGRTERVERLLERLYRIEIETTGSELEAILSEAAQIRGDRPSENVQRRTHVRRSRLRRGESILVLEPGVDECVLRAYLIHDGRWIASVEIGPRGGGLKRIERLLERHFFGGTEGPGELTGPDVDVELVVRWLAANRDRALAFDPTELATAAEVVDRLRWFLGEESPFDSDGLPLYTR